jgi:hypothetical protein
MPAIRNFAPYVGQHCETTASGSLLKHQGVDLSEPMLFGLGEGLGFIFLNLETLPLPFVGGRTKPFELTKNLCRNLGLRLSTSETSSRSKAWQQLEGTLANGAPVGLQLDSYHLEYFSHPVHFAGHCVAAYAVDEKDVWLVDTESQGSRQKSSRASVEHARFAKGPMAAKARMWTIDRGPYDLRKAVRSAIRNNATAYLSPPFKGASFHGIAKLSKSLPKWLGLSSQPRADLGLAADLMEKAGTGGALFRNFYRDFLAEAAELLPASKSALAEAHRMFVDSAELWHRIAALMRQTGETADGSLLSDAAVLCERAAANEVAAMRILSAL